MIRIIALYLVLLLLTFGTPALAVTATIYVDTNSSGDFDSGEDDDNFVNGNGGGTHNHAYDVVAPGAGSTSVVIIDFDYIDNSFQAIFNGANVCAPSICQLQAGLLDVATQSFLTFAAGDFGQPWLAHTGGLPRLRLTATESGYTLVGTRTRTSALAPIIFSSGGFGANPDFALGQNLVTVTNLDDSGPDGISGSISASFDTVEITIAKTASAPTVSVPNSNITYSLLVTNSGDYEIVRMTVNDTIATVVCPTSGGPTIALLAVGNSETCTATYQVTQNDFDTDGGGDNDIDNTGTVIGTSDDVAVSDSDSETVGLTITPSLQISKTATPDANVTAGQLVSYEYLVTNDGNVTIDGINVADIHAGAGTAPTAENEEISTDGLPLGDSTDVTQNGSWDTLRPGDTIRFTGSYIVQQDDIDAQ